MFKPSESTNNQNPEQEALNFLHKLKQSQYRDEHSYAFLTQCLRPIALNAAKEVATQLKNLPHPKLHYLVSEVEAIALVFAKPDRVFKNFELDSNVSLKNYARKFLISSIKNQIVRELNSPQINEDSDISVLQNLSISRLRKALSGFEKSISETIEHYCLAWLAFKELSAELFRKTNSVGSSVSSPLTQEQLSQIADRYNQLLIRANPPTLHYVNSEGISEMLSVCVSAFRNNSFLGAIV